MKVEDFEELIFLDKSVVFLILMSLEEKVLKELSRTRYFQKIKKLIDSVIVISNQEKCSDSKILAANFYIKTEVANRCLQN